MDTLTQIPMTFNHVNAGLVAGTTSTYTTTAATSCSIGGKFATALTAQTNTASPTTDVNTGTTFVALTANQATVLVWGVNAAGAIKLAQGSIVPTETGVTTTAGDFILAPQFPDLPDDFMVFGYLLVRTAPSASAWTAGTSSWDATGVTASATNCTASTPTTSGNNVSLTISAMSDRGYVDVTATVGGEIRTARIRANGRAPAEDYR